MLNTTASSSSYHPGIEKRLLNLSQTIPEKLLIHHPEKEYEAVSFISYLDELASSSNTTSPTALIVLAIGSIS